MVNNNDLINLVNNKKPVELVQELKDEHKIPTFEEFMKNYKSDGSLNYDDLNGGSIGEAKGHGPCAISSCPYPSKCFYLKLGFSPHPWNDRPSFLFKGRSSFQWLTMNNVEEGREVLRKFGNGDYKVIHNVHFYEKHVEKCQAKVVSEIRNYVSSHERGNNVHEDCLAIEKLIDFGGSDDGDCKII